MRGGPDRGGLRRPSRIRAALDHVVARGSGTVALTLAGMLVLIAAVAAGIRWALNPDKRIGSELWQTFVRLFDGGSYSNDVTGPDRVIGVILVLIGIIGSAAVLAIVVTAFQDTVDRVRNGRSPLLKRSDTVILGWSHEIYTLITELEASPIDQPDIAVLSRRQRAWMDAELKKVFGRRRRGLSIDCRTGDPADPADLGLVGVTRADRILVLGDPEHPDEGDLIRTVFALMNQGVDLARQRVIVAVPDRDHEAIFTSVFGNSIEVVAGHDVLSHILTQSMRAKGFGRIFEQLTSYQHADFYAHDLPAPVQNATFGELLLRCRGAIPVGITRPGGSHLLPRMDTRLDPEDRLLVLAGDNEDLRFGPADGGPVPNSDEPAGIDWSDQDILLVGWNTVVDPALAELRGFLGTASTLDAIADPTAMSVRERRSLERCAHLDSVVTPDSAVGAIATLRDRLTERSYDAVVVLPYRDTQRPDQADSRSLLHLAVVQDSVDSDLTRVVCELRESRTADLIGHIEPDDLILSDALSASLMAQLVDRPWLTGVLGDLFDFHGSALFAHLPERWGLPTGGSVRFGELITAAAARGEIAVGYRRGIEVVLAPDQDDRIPLETCEAVYVLGPAKDWTGVFDGAGVDEDSEPTRGR